MKSSLLRLAKIVGIGFALVVGVGFILQVVDPEGVKRRREESRNQQQSQPDSTDKVFEHGFVVGHEMARKGAIKPTSAELDALARKSANLLGVEGGGGFKRVWCDAFWMGWKKAD